MQKLIYDLRKDHEALKSKQHADNMAHIHLLTGVAQSVGNVHADVAKLNKQIWGAIKELRVANRSIKESK